MALEFIKLRRVYGVGFKMPAETISLVKIKFLSTG
jgi:hypothetical protein